MKRYTLIVVFLITVVVLGTGVFANIRRGQAMEIKFHKSDLPEYGVNLVSSADPSFDGIAAKHFKNKQPKTLKPFAVFITNSSARLVVAYALTWELKDENGRNITTKTVGYSEPGILIGNEIPPNLIHTTAIEPGKERCFSWDSKIDPAQVEINNVRNPILAMVEAELARATDVTVALDAVVFDDGSVVGPNKTAFVDQMRAMVAAKGDLLRDIAAASERGDVDQVLDSIGALAQEPEVVFGSTFSTDEWYRHFKKVYATEIANQRAAYGKERLIPFLVKSHKRVKKIKSIGE